MRDTQSPITKGEKQVSTSLAHNRGQTQLLAWEACMLRYQCSIAPSVLVHSYSGTWILHPMGCLSQRALSRHCLVSSLDLSSPETATPLLGGWSLVPVTCPPLPKTSCNEMCEKEFVLEWSLSMWCCLMPAFLGILCMISSVHIFV